MKEEIKEDYTMNNNTMELNLNELEMINGGWNWKGFGVGFATGAGYGVFIGGSLGVCVGGGVGGVVGAAIGGVAGGVAMGIAGGRK